MIAGGSVEVTADAQVATGPGRVLGVVLTPAAAVASLILYDNTAASGTKLLTLQAAANGASVPVDIPFVFSAGVYADIGGAGATAYVILG